MFVNETPFEYTWEGRNYVVNEDSFVEGGVEGGAEEEIAFSTQEKSGKKRKLCSLPSSAEEQENVVESNEFVGCHPAVTVPLLFNSCRVDDQSPSICDVVVTAPTGQGKTLCYALPIMSSLYYSTVPEILALIIAPTRELVLQIHGVFNAFRTPGQTGIKKEKVIVCVLAGLKPFAAEQNSLISEASISKREAFGTNVPQKDAARVVIATPGRFVEHFRSKYSCSSADVVSQLMVKKKNTQNIKDHATRAMWSHVCWIVMDEVDRLLEQQYQSWIKELNRIDMQCSLRPRHIIATATMIQNPEKLYTLGLLRPLFFWAAGDQRNYRVPMTLKQKWVLCPAVCKDIGSTEMKPLVFLYLLHQLYTVGDAKNEGLSCKKALKCIIFCSSKEVAMCLSTLIHLHFSGECGNGFPAYVHVLDMAVTEKATGNALKLVHCETNLYTLHAAHFTANLSHKERAHLLRRFHDPKECLDILVCSDILARGLDVHNLDVVINYDCPSNLRMYIHRIGRTARAGRDGMALTLVTANELPAFKKMLNSNKLSQGASAYDGDLTLWDITHKHSVHPDHLFDWVASPHRSWETQASRNPPHSTKGNTSSYYSCLLQKLSVFHGTCHTVSPHLSLY